MKTNAFDKKNVKNKNNNKERYAFVNFLNSDYKYIYKCDKNIRVGDVVEAPTNNYAFKNPAIVREVKKLAEWQLPIAKTRILKINRIISWQDIDGIFDNSKYIKKHIDWRFLKEWKENGQNDWMTSWKSDFGYTLSYEQDGVFEVFYFNEKTEDVFEYYTITSKKDFDMKVSYAQTIISQYYHQIISEEAFKTMFERVSF